MGVAQVYLDGDIDNSVYINALELHDKVSITVYKSLCLDQISPKSPNTLLPLCNDKVLPNEHIITDKLTTHTLTVSILPSNKLPKFKILFVLSC
jgi:hypothetical protein